VTATYKFALAAAKPTIYLSPNGGRVAVPTVGKGEKGDPGPEGPVGPSGGPVPAGGSDGQAVVKDGATAGAVRWTDHVAQGSRAEEATLAPLYVETFTTGLTDRSPDNVRTGLDSTQQTGGGYAEELTVAVTGAAGSNLLTTTETDKVAGFGTNPWAAVLSASDGSDDFWVTVRTHDGSTQITLRETLDEAFTGTLTPKYEGSLAQHLTKAATRAYARHAARAVGLFGSRGGVLEGTWSARPPAYNTAWVKNAALTAYGTVNSAAPVVQSGLGPQSAALNIRDTPDLIAFLPISQISSMVAGVHAAGHGVEATLHPRRRDAVLEFWTGTYRSGVSQAASRLTVTVTVDGNTAYSKTHDGWLTQVLVPVHGADTVAVSVTNADGGIYYIYLSQMMLREAGIGGGRSSAARKIVTMGDSWFAYYNGQFAATLAAVAGAKVVNRALGSQTTDWALSWFDPYVRDEKPDEAWFHFFTNDHNNPQSGTFVAPDGSTQPVWPTGLTAAQAKARWQANIATLIRRCQDAGIKPVIVLPGGTASIGQTHGHLDWAWSLDRPRPVGWRAADAELTAVGGYANTTGKAAGTQVFNTTTTRPLWASGAATTATWVDATGAVVHTPV